MSDLDTRKFSLPDGFSAVEASIVPFTGKSQDMNPSAAWVQHSAESLAVQLDGLPCEAVELVLAAALRKVKRASAEIAKAAIFRAHGVDMPEFTHLDRIRLVSAVTRELLAEKLQSSDPRPTSSAVCVGTAPPTDLSAAERSSSQSASPSQQPPELLDGQAECLPSDPDAVA
jgi:hypothetical protein